MVEAKIIGTGSGLPAYVMENEELTQFVDTSDTWIVSRTGIKRRRIVTTETNSDLAVLASLDAIKSAGIDSGCIDMILVATMSSDLSMPNTACQIQQEIGAKNAVCMDLNGACSGFIFGLSTATQYIRASMYKTILVVGSDIMSRHVDWRDRNTCVLFGDGAGAVVLSASKEKGVGTILLGSDGSGRDALVCENPPITNAKIKKEKYTGGYLQMTGQNVFKFVLQKIPQNILTILQREAIPLEEVKYFILHQANKRILESVAKKLEVDVERFPMNLQHYGNTSAGSIPILLDELYKQGRLQPDDKIILSGFGGGFTWGSCLITI